MFCPKCGTQNIEDAKFCRGCGADIALVPQAMTGHLPEASSDHENVVGVVWDAGRRRRHRDRDRDSPPRIDKAISNVFMGIGFLVAAIAVFLAVPGGRAWWFGFLFPGFALLGGGIAEYVRFKHSKGEEVKLPGADSKKEVPPARVSALPPRDTSELVPPPPSVTEGTTRHLDMSAKIKDER